MKVSTILCPLDFSETSKAALAAAEDLARSLDAELVLAHVVEPAVYPVAFGAVPMSTVNIEAEAKEAAQEGLRKVADELAAKGLRCTTLVDSGTASWRLVEMVKQNDIDLVVIATHGYTGLQHALLGSTAERVVRLCPCPVLTVKAGQGSD